MPIHFIGSYPSIRHRTQLLISIHSHLNTPYTLSSFMLFHFYPSIHFLLSLTPSSLIILLHSHSSSRSLSLSFHHLLIILPIHSFPHPLSPILFSFHPSSYSISIPLSYTLLPLSFTSHYRILSFYSSLCSQTPFYSHSPHSSLYHYPIPYSFTQHLFNSFSSLLSFHSHSIELEIVVFGRRTSI